MKAAHSISAIALAAQLAGCATEPAAPTSVPAALEPPGKQSLAMVLPATGVQIYQCRAVASRPGAYEWAFVAPDAELFDQAGNRIGRHYAGPHWEAADGSRVVASVAARADAPRTGAIPWLLLTARSVGPEGTFSKVTSIQRTNTVGGLAPSNGCSSAKAGAVARVDYRADYRLFTQQP
jgi:hypothetical protein